MIEIRSITPDEAPSFLKVLCEAFDLDEARASTVFYTEPFFDLDRKWALFENEIIRSVLTTTPLLFGWGRAFGIAGVATDRKHRGKGYALQLVQAVLEHGKSAGEPAALLFANQRDLYESCGFTVLDEVIRGPVIPDPVQEVRPAMEPAQVRAIYDAWAAEDPGRLVRDDQRWRAWSWMYRVCEPVEPGYVCFEANLVREAILTTGRETWPVTPATDWVGLRQFTELLRVPVRNRRHETYLMGHNFPTSPQMFLTDQF